MTCFDLKIHNTAGARRFHPSFHPQPWSQGPGPASSALLVSLVSMVSLFPVLQCANSPGAEWGDAVRTVPPVKDFSKRNWTGVNGCVCECSIAQCRWGGKCSMLWQEMRKECFLSRPGWMSWQVVAEQKEDRLCRMDGVGKIL